MTAPPQTERVQIAALLLSGLLANPHDMHQKERDDPKAGAELALTYADALYTEYNRRETLGLYEGGAVTAPATVLEGAAGA